MEDRKRSAAQDDLAPPTKRQAVNGGKNSADSDLPWAKDLEVSPCHTTSIKTYPSTIEPQQDFTVFAIFQLYQISKCFFVMSVAGANRQLTVDCMPFPAGLHSSIASAYHTVAFL
jgi:hypothetical protein